MSIGRVLGGVAFCVALGACATAGGPIITKPTRVFAAAPELVVKELANNFAAGGWFVKDATPYRFLAESENTDVMTKLMFGTEASNNRVVNRLECNLSSLAANQTNVQCRGAVVSNPDNANEKVRWDQNIPSVQAGLDQIATTKGW